MDLLFSSSLLGLGGTVLGLQQQPSHLPSSLQTFQGPGTIFELPQKQYNLPEKQASSFWNILDEQVEEDPVLNVGDHFDEDVWKRLWLLNSLPPELVEPQLCELFAKRSASLASTKEGGASEGRSGPTENLDSEQKSSSPFRMSNLGSFVKRLVKGAGSLPTTIVTACIYLERLKRAIGLESSQDFCDAAKDSKDSLNSNKPQSAASPIPEKSWRPKGKIETAFRVASTALLLATKHSLDNPPSNAYWTMNVAVDMTMNHPKQELGFVLPSPPHPLFSLEEVNRMERQFLKALDYHLDVRPEEMAHWMGANHESLVVVEDDSISNDSEKPLVAFPDESDYHSATSEATIHDNFEVFFADIHSTDPFSYSESSILPPHYSSWLHSQNSFGPLVTAAY